MKRIASILFTCLLLVSCSEDDGDTVTQIKTTFNFTHNWDGTQVTNADFNTIQYTNANGEELSIEKLRYLISKITFQKSNGDTFIFDDYNLVDVTNNTNLSFSSTTTIPTGNYTKVSFIFGFNNDDNYNNNYTNLNSASWSVPAMLGGGYHYMQLEGKFINNATAETGYAYHAIQAVDNSSATQIFENTFFEVNLGTVVITNDAIFNIKMNIAEWFKNPNTWDLNALNNMLMPNYDVSKRPKCF